MLRQAVNLVSVAALTLVCTMTAWTLLPLAFGLTASVVMSGSMEPQLRPGDIVVTLPRAANELSPGQIISFADPNDPDRRLTHKLMSINADGTFVTRGTANNSDDSTPVTADLVYGQAVLRVPWVGLPSYWLRTGQLLQVGLLATFLLVAIAAATDEPRRPGGPRPPGARTATRTLHPSALPTVLPARA